MESEREDLRPARHAHHRLEQSLLNAAIGRARQLDRRVWVAVADSAGQIVGLVGCDGAPRISRQVAQDKAFTASVTGMPTRAWKEYLDSIPASEREIIARHDGFVAADGGFPILDGERGPGLVRPARLPCGRAASGPRRAWLRPAARARAR